MTFFNPQPGWLESARKTESMGKMGTRLYIGNMSTETTEQELRTLFSEAGTVQSVEVPLNPRTGKPRGFAFVTMLSQDEAEKALTMFNAIDLNSHTIKVNITLPREEALGSGSTNKEQ